LGLVLEAHIKPLGVGYSKFELKSRIAVYAFLHIEISGEQCVLSLNF
jgi:hypothetical protein